MANQDDEIKIEDENELKYQELIYLMEATKCMAPSDAKRDAFLKMKDEFIELSGYQDAEEYAQKCSRLIEQVNDDIMIKTYEQAKKMQDKAKNEADYKLAAVEFRKVSGYMDADEMAVICDEMRIAMDKKRIVKQVGILLCIILIIIGLNSRPVKYYLADKRMARGSLSSAIKTYDKLGNYKDSTEKLMKAQYQKGLELEGNNDFVRAEEIFLELKDYKDSEDRIIEMTKKIIQNSEIGNTVKVGRFKWIILEKEEEQVLLMKKGAIKAVPYHNTLEELTWEKSTIRSYLNTEFLDEAFSEKEQSRIILTKVINDDNEIYATEGGKDTQDYAYLLSIRQAREYYLIFPKIIGNSWLRTPGYAKNSAAFFTEDKTVMDYGYAVTESTFTAHPVIWLDIR